MAAQRKKPAASQSKSEGFDAFNFGNQEFFAGAMEQMTESMTAFTEFQKAAYETAVSSASTFAKTVEKATAENTDVAKENYEEGVAAAKAIASSKNVQDAFAAQNDYFRSAFEKNIKQVSKSADQWTALTQEIAEPLTQQYSEFVGKVQAFRP